MTPATASTALVLGLVLLPGPRMGGTLSAQTTNPALASAPTPACALLSVAEVRRITGRPGYLDHVSGDAPGEGVGGGSSCTYDGPAFGTGDRPPMVAIALIPGKDWTRRRQSVRLPDGCRREAVNGVGDVAFFERCPAPGRAIRTAPLYVKVGTSDLIVQIDIEAGAAEADVRPTVIAVARAAAARLK